MGGNSDWRYSLCTYRTDLKNRITYGDYCTHSILKAEAIAVVLHESRNSVFMFFPYQLKLNVSKRGWGEPLFSLQRAVAVRFNDNRHT